MEFADGSVLAQLGSADMRGPIQYALTHPARASRRARTLDLVAMRRLDFAPPDAARFPALGLAYRVIREGGTSGAIFNAASEEATAIFLANGSAPTPPDGATASSPRPRETGDAEPAIAAAATATRPTTSRVAFGQIPELAAAAMDALGVKPVRTLADVLEADAAARRFVRERVGG